MNFMKSFLTRKIPLRMSAAAGIMVLVASVVMGRESPLAPQAASVSARSAASAAVTESLPDLDLERLQRTRKSEGGADLFAPAHSAAPLAAPAAVAADPAPPASPGAPPLPFTYLGKFVDGEKVEVFIAHGDEHYTAARGKTIEGRYKIENVTAGAVTFIYLPLGTRQKLAIPADAKH